MDEDKIRAGEALDVATAMLIEEGYAGLSFRKVAAGAGMGIGNLQHYFPTKADLIRALLDRLFTRFDASMMARRTTDGGPAAELDAAVDYALLDQTSRESCVLLWEIWALAARDPHANDLLIEFYDKYVGYISQTIKRVRPEITPERARCAATLAAALIEGVSLFRGPGRAPKLAPNGFDEALRKALMRILDEA